MSVDFYLEHVKGILDEVKGDMKKIESDKSEWKITIIDNMLDKIHGAKESLKEIQSEMNLVPTTEKYNVMKSVQQYSNDIELIENSLNNNRQRSQLMAGATPQSMGVQESLIGISQTMSETNNIGNGILTQLSNQRNKLMHAHGNVHQIDDTVSQARQVVQRMIQRANQNKLIAYGCVALLVIGILLVLYIYF
ncbi:Vesicle transport v-SNARE protein [Trichomonas vaginalis G3]|uniref:Vesicle transport v-SNARE protein n=1 Tax=Trichomonas vaginalis (strain ATCC PRA-98 / G3) TaxID=412133 RepID=A2EMK1_TRIV3|nr:vesicle fusion with Golgi apparatus [Trichomonas vaginalis G3]EAY06157.1 Vesicle transport v-SNARE protein [Trichomonas vaginalis G3]KAI5516989.1 vesicle fusion with Golgi apparatus [Trichomonas vaginalis G3]|eukprot:XP_001318380.1 Vesicle transport v-SNARE protein [Trichomonas vaginalis G3]